jgi:small subunit ribosomal protein S3Ae
MAVGKNKRLSKGGKKGNKKKIIDPFTRKEWFEMYAPGQFSTRRMGQTLVNKTQGTKIASEGLKGRVVEMSLGDISQTSDEFRKFKLIIEDVQGKNCLTNFHGMDFTRDKLASMVKKWTTLVEANCAVKTADGYLLRMFCIAFTKRSQFQVKKTSYAQKSKVRAIRAKMIEIMSKEAASGELKDLVTKLIPDSISGDIVKACSHVFPLENVFVRKVKVLRKPKIDLGKLMDIHGDIKSGAGTAGDPVNRPDDYEPPVLEDV